MFFRVLIFLMSLVLVPVFATAEMNQSVDQMSEKEMVIQEKARKRLYPGGRDESDLIIHPQAIIASRKLHRREVEKEVYKQLFNEELKGDSGSPEGEEESEED